jgi:Tfp pilus assembly pilus retraction ATPase PilT
MATLSELLQSLVENGADSLQLRADSAPLLLVERQPRPLPGPALTTGEIDALVEFLVEPDARALFESRGLHDGVFDAPRTGRFNYRIRRLPDGTALAFRPVSAEITQTTSNGWPVHSIHALLVAAWNRGASDIILSGGLSASVRLAGELVGLPGVSFSDDAILASLGNMLTADRRRQLETQGNLDLAVEVPDGERTHRFRANVFRQLRGIAAAFRPIWDRIPELSTLHLPVDLLTMTDQPHGLILVVGPTGAGKSTTLAVLLEHLNRTQARHIITLEDPIEHLFRPQRSLVHQREVGVHVESFSRAFELRCASVRTSSSSEKCATSTPLPRR